MSVGVVWDAVRALRAIEESRPSFAFIDTFDAECGLALHGIRFGVTTHGGTRTGALYTDAEAEDSWDPPIVASADKVLDLVVLAIWTSATPTPPNPPPPGNPGPNDRTHRAKKS